MKTKVKIMDQEWTFEKVEAHDAHLMVDSKACLGTTWSVKRAMYVSDELGPDRALQTIRHELTHAYLAATQISDPESYDDEAICDTVAIYGPAIVAAAEKVYFDLNGGTLV